LTANYFQKVAPTYIENWPAALSLLSIEQTPIALDWGEARAIGRTYPGAATWFDGASSALDALAGKLQRAIAGYDRGAFVRLGSRSPKDTSLARRAGMRVDNAAGALALLTAGSRRLAADLRLALDHGHVPHLYVRRWHNIPAWAEFRCFMRNRALVGLSQYDTRNLGHAPELAARAAPLETGLRAFFLRLRESSHLDTAVFDVFFEDAVEPEPSRPVLLEVNPFYLRTGSCLFDFARDDFDGSFRYL
jgi:hypothetical protein